MKSCKYSVYYDGACPVCRIEINNIRRRDTAHAINFIDISADDFDANDIGITQERLMSRIHAQRTDGEWEIGMPVLRQMYREAGLEQWIAWTAHPVASRAMDRFYAWFADHRMLISSVLKPVLQAIRYFRK